jgi:hypothetical protein
MEVGQGPNWGCSAKEKKNGVGLPTIFQMWSLIWHLTIAFPDCLDINPLPSQIESHYSWESYTHHKAINISPSISLTLLYIQEHFITLLETSPDISPYIQR